MKTLDKQVKGFRQTVRQFLRSKSNWTGLTMVATAAAGYYAGVYALPEAITQVMGGLAVLFVRDAIAGRADDQPRA